ncbi:hypothetical protein NEDG_01134 [Nematocida displodere]|uniref:Uncharacterized protein n=1 Tax=Nematocida displodere TaxID=1805483 RepID=A0A177EAP8_9MICR|nr:hypothetical protein NEDG_01134 [Nematocida displodere]
MDAPLIGATTPGPDKKESAEPLEKKVEPQKEEPRIITWIRKGILTALLLFAIYTTQSLFKFFFNDMRTYLISIGRYVKTSNESFTTNQMVGWMLLTNSIFNGLITLTYLVVGTVYAIARDKSDLSNPTETPADRKKMGKTEPRWFYSFWP